MSSFVHFLSLFQGLDDVLHFPKKKCFSFLSWFPFVYIMIWISGGVVIVDGMASYR